MLLENYSLEIFNSACNPNAASVHCYAHLDKDVSEALPYLNAVLGGFEYIEDPPSVTFRAHGKLIAVHGRKIAPRPQIIEILKLLPKTNCRECREPTCMVFALRVAEGVKDGRDCPALDTASQRSLDVYLGRFNLDC